MSDVDTSAPEATPLAVIEAPSDGGATDSDTPDPNTVLEGVASEMGWSPKDKWKGDPEKWRDATAFLKATPQVLKSTREQMERSARVAAQAIERNQRAAIADAEARIAAAVEAGDKEGAIQAAQDRAEASRAPDPLVEEFAVKNPWMLTNKKANRLALEAAQEVADNGGSVAEQLSAAEKEVRKRFPEEFGEAPAETTARRDPPAVQGGQRTANAAPRKRGWSDMPQHARDLNEKHFVRKGLLTREEAAESYWSENA
jgi:hypothetical protein